MCVKDFQITGTVTSPQCNCGAVLIFFNFQGIHEYESEEKAKAGVAFLDGEHTADESDFVPFLNRGYESVEQLKSSGEDEGASCSGYRLTEASDPAPQK